MIGDNMDYFVVVYMVFMIFPFKQPGFSLLDSFFQYC